MSRSASVLGRREGFRVAAPDAWPLQHPVPTSLARIVVILVVFVPLSIQRYKKAVSR